MRVCVCVELVALLTSKCVQHAIWLQYTCGKKVNEEIENVQEFKERKELNLMESERGERRGVS